MAQPRDQGTATIGRIEDWLRQHEREAIVGLVALAAALRVVLIADAPSYGFVWDFYREGVAVLVTTGRLPVAADCWQCYHPPLFYLAGWAPYRVGLWLGGPEVADRLLSGLGLCAVSVLVWYGYRLLRLLGFSGAPLVGGVALLLASPLLLFSSYGAEADALLAALLTAFLFHLVRACSRPEGMRLRDAVGVGLLAGAAMATKYSGLVALGTAGVVMMMRLGHDGLRGVRAGLVVLGVALAVGGWTYLDNYRTYGTPLHANGSASEGLRLGAIANRGGYDFTSFRVQELRALFGPRPEPGPLTGFPVYRSVLTSLHAQAWSDMSFFSLPSRHGDPSQPYRSRRPPVNLVMTLVLLGLVPMALALVGVVVTWRLLAWWPLAAIAGVTLIAYVAWFLPQEAWALKTKYISVLVPVQAAYAMAGGRWLGQRRRWLGWVVAAAVGGLTGCAFVYQFAFANGRLAL